MAKGFSRKGGKRALVTGATGYIGLHLVKRLMADGWVVHALVPDFESSEKLKGHSGRIAIHSYDGKTETVFAALRKAKPAVVFHLAAKVCVEHSAGQIETLIAANVLLGTQILDGMARLGIRHFINTGTYWQHYRSRAYDPVNLYAATKQAFEDILLFYTATAGIRAITLKLFDVYGPDDPRNKIISLFDRHSRSGLPLVMTRGEQLMDLVHVDDVAGAFCYAADLLRKSPEKKLKTCYAVSSSRRVSLRKVAAIYQRVTGRTVKIRWGGRPYRAREVMKPWKGMLLPGWKPTIDLEQGLLEITR